mmetsp:Transcript_64997/g.146583  ORF Transcript_64997/g.146583 Transcript_64997/m.146583 type:complete len:94 (-) Transcript_64997:586-867(-)
MVAGHVLAAVLTLEVLKAEVHDAVVKVLPAQVGVTGCCLDLKDSVFDSQKGHVEGAASHVVDQNVALSAALLVQTVGNGSRSWLVDDSQHVHA